MARHDKNQLNLYSFQDIVTATIGILLITVLILLLSLVTTRQEESAQAKDEFETYSQTVIQANKQFEEVKGIQGRYDYYQQLRNAMAGYLNTELQNARTAKQEYEHQVLLIKVPKTDPRYDKPLVVVADKGNDVYSLQPDGRPYSKIISKAHLESIYNEGGFTTVVALLTPAGLESVNEVAWELRRNPTVMRDIIPHNDFLIILEHE